MKLDISQLSPLLEKDMLAAVTDVFINERKQGFSEWIPKIISSEVKVCFILSHAFLNHFLRSIRGLGSEERSRTHLRTLLHYNNASNVN